MLTDPDRRFARHLALEGFGEAAQATLQKSSVLVVGAGGLGAPLLSYLAAGGIGRIGIIDHDHVELSNLPRQIIYEEGDIGRLKVQAAADRLSELAPYLEVDCYPQRLQEANASAIINRYDLVADGCDHFVTRHLVNRQCWQHGIPLVSASVLGFEGQMLTVIPRADTPCYQCLVPAIPEGPDRCSDTGVLGPVCGVMGSMQAVEVMQVLTQTHDSLAGKWLRYDARSHRLAVSKLSKDPACPICRQPA